MATDHAAAEHGHSSAAKYVQIAVILFVLTALEVLLYEVCYGSLASSGGMSNSLEPWFVEILLGLSALKFWFVAMFYMHLKFDMKLLSAVFAFSLLIAAIMIIAL